jgi:hypothetical protein
MPLPASVTSVTSQLPFALRQDIEGYLRTLQDARVEIYREVDVTTKEVPTEQWLLLATIWRLYTQVEGQRWVVHNSLEIAGEYGAVGISAGRFRYSKGSDDVNEIRELQKSFERWLHRRDLDFLKLADGPRDVLEALRPSRDAR